MVLRRSVKRYSVVAALVGIVWLAFPPSLCAQKVDETKALKVKAAYLYNFAKFVHWPDEAFENEESPITIGVLGVDPFGAILDGTMKNKTVGGRTLTVRRFAYLNEDNVEALRNCHILYVSESERSRLKETLRALGGSNVLVVGEGEAFAPAGGMIGLVLEKGKVAFHINLPAVERAKLRISAKLLDLAKIVRNTEASSGIRSPSGGRPHHERAAVCSNGPVEARLREPGVRAT